MSGCGGAAVVAKLEAGEGELGREWTGVFVKARKERGGMEGAQHAGAVRGFGGIKGSNDRGSRRRLADRSSAAVVKVMPNATANRSCSAVCGVTVVVVWQRSTWRISR